MMVVRKAHCISLTEVNLASAAHNRVHAATRSLQKIFGKNQLM